MKTWNKWLMMALGLLAFSACSDPEVPAEETPSFLGPNEKADNFFSESAQEYYVRGTAQLTLEPEFANQTEEQRLARVAELIPYKQVQIGYFLNSYLIDKSGDDANANYGGVKALTKNGSYEDMGIEKVSDLTYNFNFVQEVGGQFDLLRELSRKANAEEQADGSYRFRLAVGKLTNEQMMQLDHESEWYRSAPWSGFTPDAVDASLVDYQELDLIAQERSKDAWIDYERLFEDGKLEVAAFYGWDYHGDYHRKHAETTYNWLVRKGFKSPVNSWSEYATNRGPLTYTLSANGKPVEVSITLWWGEPGTETDPDTDAGGRRLENEMRASFAEHDVTMFSGHSGPWYGFALANWRKTAEGDLDDSEVPRLEMPANKYQVVLAEGCDTYALGQAFWANPNKADRNNLDIITTTSFSNAATSKVVTDFLQALVGTSTGNVHKPMRYGTMLKSMDSASSWFKTMYGVHGIDDNPNGHPYANQDALCGDCRSNAECGGEGNRCVTLEGSKVCTFECTSDAGCPDGYTCRQTATSGWISESYCMPTSFSCDVLPEPEPAKVLISEVLADVPEGAAGDINGDGARHFGEDEFLEIHNPGTTAVELAGYTLSDNVMARFTFPLGAKIEPGGYVVVFGGGDASNFTGLPEVPVFTAPGLFLNNGGDSVTLIDRDSALIDRVQYGREGGQDKSLIRVSADTEELRQAATPTPGAAND
jgi:hypothetical protein